MTMQTAPTQPSELVKRLNWRYAVKKFDPARKIPDETWNALEEALVLSPSSYGLQPWKFFVVDDPKVRAQLRAASWDQTQITDASRLVVFAGRKDFAEADIDRHLARIADVRKADPASLAPIKQMMAGVLKKPADVLRAWIARQVYIALGNFLASAAALGVDACPMEGFDPAQYDAILGLPAKGYTALVVATAGHRSADDAYARAAKVRYPKHELVTHI